jgi:hypothetical protein
MYTLSIVLYWKVAAQEHEMNDKDQNKIDPFSTSTLFSFSKSSKSFRRSEVVARRKFCLFVFLVFTTKTRKSRKILKLKQRK